MAKIDLEDRGRSLEEEFFHKQQARQVEALREKRERGEAVAALSAASGLSNEAVLGNLVDLGVSAASLTAFALVPLVHVAWADGKLDDKERAAILAAAAEMGITEDSPGHAYLAELLAARPAKALFQSWQAFVASLRSEAGPEAFGAIAGDVAARARSVAEAAGGILGIGSVSQAESDALASVEAALS